MMAVIGKLKRPMRTSEVARLKMKTVRTEKETLACLPSLLSRRRQEEGGGREAPEGDVDDEEVPGDADEPDDGVERPEHGLDAREVHQLREQRLDLRHPESARLPKIGFARG